MKNVAITPLHHARIEWELHNLRWLNHALQLNIDCLEMTSRPIEQTVGLVLAECAKIQAEYTRRQKWVMDIGVTAEMIIAELRRMKARGE